jgi:hypothetical protein
LNQPTEQSFQGQAPDLKGLVVQLTWDQNLGSSTPTTPIAEGNPLWGNLITTPGYCDIDYDGNVVGNNGYDGLQLTYKGSNPQSQQLLIPHVVKASGLHITQGSFVEWYSDARPNFSGVTYNITYDRGWNGLGNFSHNPPIWENESVRSIDVPVTAVYPKVDYTNAAKDKNLGIFIGKHYLDTSTSPAGWGTNSGWESLKITKYHQVVGVDYVPGTNWDAYYDDNLDAFYTNGSPDAAKILANFKKDNVKFKISYTEGEPRDIDMTEFLANGEWYYRQIGLSTVGYNPVTYMVDRLVQTAGTTSKPGDITTVLNYGTNEDYEESWEVTLDYAPIDFNAVGAWGQVIVPVDLYIFDGDVVVERKYTAGDTVIFAHDEDDYVGQNMQQGELDTIAGKWQLRASYSSSNKPAAERSKQRAIGLTSQMFYDGYYGTSVKTMYTGSGAASMGWGWDSLRNDTAPTPSTFVAQLVGNLSAWNNSAIWGVTNSVSNPTVPYVRDFILPVYYRGVGIDTDESVLVRLLAK